jgi:hypothetical protein
VIPNRSRNRRERCEACRYPTSNPIAATGKSLITRSSAARCRRTRVSSAVNVMPAAAKARSSSRVETETSAARVASLTSGPGERSSRGDGRSRQGAPRRARPQALPFAPGHCGLRVSCDASSLTADGVTGRDGRRRWRSAGGSDGTVYASSDPRCASRSATPPRHRGITAPAAEGRRPFLRGLRAAAGRGRAPRPARARRRG